MHILNGFKSQSQHGEDFAIAELIHKNSENWFVDVGAHDGRSWSNSYLFGKVGFNLLLIEPMEVCANKCRKLWAGNRRVHVEQKAVSEADGVVNFYIHDNKEIDLLAIRSSLMQEIIPSNDISKVSVESIPLNKLLDKHRVPRNFAALSVDAEGVDLQVLRSVDLKKYRPSVICVEDEIDHDRIEAHLRDQGYSEVQRLGPNGIYIDKNGIYEPTSDSPTSESMLDKIIGRIGQRFIPSKKR